jgi:hypothetical protein
MDDTERLRIVTTQRDAYIRVRGGLEHRLALMIAERDAMQRRAESAEADWQAAEAALAELKAAVLKIESWPGVGPQAKIANSQAIHEARELAGAKRK